MKVSSLGIPGVLLFEPEVHGDGRGWFFESWHRQRYAALGLDKDFVQDNFSFSRHGILRGLHFQNPRSQGKLVQVLQGEVFDVAVDIRRGSPTFLQWIGITLSAANHRQLYIPEGFAHGFCVLSECALFSYKCTDYYAPEYEFSLRFDDPELAIDWPIREPRLSAKDQAGKTLRELWDKLPLYSS